MDSAVFVEKAMPGNLRSLEPVSRPSRGDRVVTVVTWYRMGGDGGFVITNPLPRSIAYEGSARDDQEVSVDGGRTWGHLGELRIGGRPRPADVHPHALAYFAGQRGARSWPDRLQRHRPLKRHHSSIGASTRRRFTAWTKLAASQPSTTRWRN